MALILIIEDNDGIRENLAELLELEEYEIALATNGREGIELAGTILPDLIISDILMPEVSGYEVLKAIKKNPGTRDIPFIFLTASTESADIQKGLDHGAVEYITKPFDDLELLATLKKWLAS